MHRSPYPKSPRNYPKSPRKAPARPWWPSWQSSKHSGSRRARLTWAQDRVFCLVYFLSNHAPSGESHQPSTLRLRVQGLVFFCCRVPSWAALGVLSISVLEGLDKGFCIWGFRVVGVRMTECSTSFCLKYPSELTARR